MRLHPDIVKLFLWAESRLCPQYCGVVDRRRVIAFFFLILTEIFVVPFHLVLFCVLHEPCGLTLEIIYTCIFILLQVLVWKRKMQFLTGLNASYLLLTLKLGVDSIFCPYFGAENDYVSVLGNIFVLFILAVTAYAQMMKKTALVITIGLIPIIIIYYIAQPLSEFLFAAKSIFVGFILIGYVITYNMSLMTKGLRQPKKLNKQEQKALDMLANLKDMDYGKAGSLMERLDPELRQRIIKHASEHLRKEEIEKLAWDMVCADLTKSEKEICKLVVQGRNLKEICALLDKAESNITSQRSHIRKKLKLSRKDDLQRALEMRLAEIREAGYTEPSHG